MKTFNIPVVLFMFKRVEKTVQIINQIARVKPRKIYLIADGPRNEDEIETVNNCRQAVEKHVNWDCEVIKNYAEKNRGVYQNIAGGAKWVFEREGMAIFLEDDNFPELSFFRYCEELLYKYQFDTRILWICGTNYMQKFLPRDGSDYVFTKLMLPCGWASWADKFNQFYDGDMRLYSDNRLKHLIKESYYSNALYDQNIRNWNNEYVRISQGEQPISWDYQMAFSIRANSLFGIAPKYNLIRNIGVDTDSIHGGTSMQIEMVSRFCEVPTYELEFPLKHPSVVFVDSEFERKTEKIILAPLRNRLLAKIGKLIKRVLRIEQSKSLTKILRINQ